MTSEPEHHSPAWWDERYRTGTTGWDHGTVAPEVQAYAAEYPGADGWAMDIGCGTGTHGRELARNGYRVVGIDLSHVALHKALVSAHAENLRWSGVQASASDLAMLNQTFNMALDIGCFHNLGLEQQQAYAAGLARRLAPGGHYLLYAAQPRPPVEQRGPLGLDPEQTMAVLKPHLKLVWRQTGWHGERGSDWWLWQKMAK